MKVTLIFLFLLIPVLLLGSENFLISDSDFTNCDITTEDLYPLLKKGTIIYKEDLKSIVKAAKEFRISPLVLCVKVEQEQGLFTIVLTKNNKSRLERAKRRATGYASYYNWKRRKKGLPPKFETFYEQIRGCAKLLRKHFNLYKKSIRAPYKPNAILPKGHPGYAKPQNASTYALYRYCPVYDAYWNDNKTKGYGNITFERVWRRFYGKYIKATQK